MVFGSDHCDKFRYVQNR